MSRACRRCVVRCSVCRAHMANVSNRFSPKTSQPACTSGLTTRIDRASVCVLLRNRMQHNFWPDRAKRLDVRRVIAVQCVHAHAHFVLAVAIRLGQSRRKRKSSTARRRYCVIWHSAMVDGWTNTRNNYHILPVRMECVLFGLAECRRMLRILVYTVCNTIIADLCQHSWFAEKKPFDAQSSRTHTKIIADASTHTDNQPCRRNLSPHADMSRTASHLFDYVRVASALFPN